MDIGSLGSVLLLASILVVQMQVIQAYYNQLEEMDRELFGKCNGKSAGISDSEFKPLYACKSNDYRCFKDCQLKVMGMVNYEGVINKKQLQSFFQHKSKQFGFKDEAYAEAMANCADKVKLAYTRPSCNETEKYLKCSIEQHYKQCYPKDDIPPVPTLCRKDNCSL